MRTLEQGVTRATERSFTLPGVRQASRACAFIFSFACSIALADVPLQVEYSKLIQSRSMLNATGTDLFGDRVNLFTGSLEFVQEDVSIPGNSTLPVAAGRRFVEGHGGDWQVTTGHFGDWDLEIPRIHGVFSHSGGWRMQIAGALSSKRCSNFGAPPTTDADQGPNTGKFSAGEYWQGTFLYLPGSGDHEILRRNTTTSRPNSLQPIDGKKGGYPLVTKADAAIGCIAINGDSANEGFRVRTPDGRIYTFDHLVSRPYPTLSKGFGNAMAYPGSNGLNTFLIPDGYLLQRREYWMLPTQISDQYGNKVIYEWDSTDPWRLNEIRGESSGETDRLLTFHYHSGTGGDNPPRIQYVDADVLEDGVTRRRWEYRYNGTRLTQVLLPDSSTWEFSLLSLLSADIGDGGNCDIVAADGPVVTGTMTHPSGATGAFETAPIVRTRTWVPRECIAADQSDPTYSVAVWPYKYISRALKQKTITAAGLSTLTWKYNYAAEPACWADPNTSLQINGAAFPPLPMGTTGCNEESTKTKVYTTVVDPRNDSTVYTYGNRFRVNEGQLQQIEVQGSASRTTTMEYSAPDAAYTWPNPIGLSEQIRGDSYLGTVHTPMTERVITEGDVDFTRTVDDFDNRARPIKETRGSNLDQTLAPMSRTDLTTYADFPAIWVLGLTDTLAIKLDPSNTVTAVDNAYYSGTGALNYSWQFGSNQQTYTYHGNGMLNQHTDPRGNVTTYTGHKRGIPLSIAYADGSSESAQVNDYGLVTSVTDEVSATTSYKYDPMGRVREITQPTGDPITWNSTSITYSKVAVAEYGFPVNHWKRSEITGTFQRDTFYDALWRPVLEREYDNTIQDPVALAGLQRFVRRSYDHAGRVTFVSYPKESGSLTTPASGTAWTYDALGRLRTTTQASELGSLLTQTEYLAGPDPVDPSHIVYRKSVTDPRLHTTHFTYQAFDEPNEDRPVQIDQPEDAHTEIKRNIFGNVTEIKRKNGAGSVSATRSYVYDAYQRLCMSFEPESRATVRDYYADGSLQWITEGFEPPITTACNTASVSPAAKTVYTYDSRNRPELINYPAGTSDVSMTYWPDGALETTTTEGATWTYSYNNRRLLETESLAFDGQQFLLDWSYNANGARTQLMYPDDSIVAYQPNAFGEATQAGAYASSVKYHPDRAMKSFAYGNGILHTLTKNGRDLPLRSKDAGVIEYEHRYDGNGNVEMIIDHAQSGTETRTMTYDALNRLKTVSAPGLWGSATYTYDQLDNITKSEVGTRTYTHVIDGVTNRLDYLSHTGSTIDYDYGYDTRGNATLRGTQAFTYDRANRLKSATNVESYDYDGHGRRVLIEKAGGEKTYQVYSRDGELLFGYDVASGKSTNYINLNGSLVARSETLPGSAGPGVPANLRASPNPSNNGAYTVAWDAVQGATSYVLEQTSPEGTPSFPYSGIQLSWATAGKPPGRYQYRIKACSDVCGDWSTSIRVIVIGVPSISVAPNPSTNGSYTVSWTAVTGAASYALEEKPPGENWRSVSTGSLDLSWPTSGRPTGSYEYRVHACLASGCGNYSLTVVEQVTTVLPPDIPVMNPPTPNPSYNGAYRVSWSSETGATGYRLEERIGSGVWTPIQNSSSTFRDITGRSTGTYSYRAQACNSVCSSYSNVVTETVNISNPPGQPGYISSNDNPSDDGTYTLSWPSVPTATSYILERRNIGTTTWTNAATQTGQTWNSPNEPDGMYEFRVKACHTACGSYSNVYTQVVLRAPTPTATPNPSTGPIHVSWTPSAIAESYELQERLNGGSWPGVGGGFNTTQTSTDLVRGNGTYEFRVRACVYHPVTWNAYCSGYGSVATVVVQQSTIPPAPATISGPPLLPCKPSPRTYTISWDPSPGATRYELHEWNDIEPGRPGPIDQIVTVLPPETDETFMRSAPVGSAGSSMHFYEVRACSANGCSPYTSQVDVCVGIPLIINGSSPTTTYVHTDALHSPVAETNETGAVTKRFRYEPYGAPTTGSYEQGPGYTGHVTDASTGLSYMQQRYYDPMAGRFLSVDPVTAYGGDMQHFSRYAYAYNSPYKFTDPDGRCPQCAWGVPIGAGVNFVVQMAAGQGSFSERLSNVSWGQVGVAAVAGGLSGGVSAIASTATTTTGVVVANVVGNAGVGAVATQASAQIEGKTASVGEVVQGAALSGAASGAGAAIEAAPGVLARMASSGMSQTERVATGNLLGGIKKATPDFQYTNPAQTAANATGAAVSASPDLKPLVDE